MYGNHALRFRRDYTSATLCPSCVEEYTQDEDNVPIDELEDDSDEIGFLKLSAWQCYMCSGCGPYSKITTEAAFDDMECDSCGANFEDTKDEEYN